MVYWLSNTYALFFLLQRSLKATGGKPLTPTSFFGRMTQGCCNSKSQRKTCQRHHSTVMQRSLNFRLRCLSLWTSLSTHFTAIKISFLESIFGMVVNIFVYGGHILFLFSVLYGIILLF
ncbi:hypothetical protein ACSBR2_013363 [Camellia fascicularis]